MPIQVLENIILRCQSSYQSKPVMSRHRWGTRQMPPLWWPPIDACPLQRGTMMTTTGPSIPWCCPSITYAVYLCNAFHPRSPVVWSLARHHGDRHGWTMITCNALRLTEKATEARLGYWSAAIRSRSFYASCMKCQTSFCSIYFQRPGFAFPDQPSTSSSRTHREAPTRQEYNLSGKTDGFVFP